MKVELNNEAPVWKPVVLTITLESKEELGVLNDLFGHDVSVPEWFYESGEKRQLLTKLMSQLWRTMKELK